MLDLQGERARAPIVIAWNAAAPYQTMTTRHADDIALGAWLRNHTLERCINVLWPSPPCPVDLRARQLVIGRPAAFAAQGECECIALPRQARPRCVAAASGQPARKNVGRTGWATGGAGIDRVGAVEPGNLRISSPLPEIPWPTLEKQVGVTVNQPSQQSGISQIDGLHANGRMRPHLRRRTNILDLAVFNQHGGGRKHIPGPGIEQSTSLHQCQENGRLSGESPIESST
jgi:hypothetical protein